MTAMSEQDLAEQVVRNHWDSKHKQRHQHWEMEVELERQLFERRTPSPHEVTAILAG